MMFKYSDPTFILEILMRKLCVFVLLFFLFPVTGFSERQNQTGDMSKVSPDFSDFKRVATSVLARIAH